MKNFKKLKKIFFIAEIGNNHEGNIKNALKLIDQAKISGADAVKFQTFDTNLFINKSEKKGFKRLKKFEFTKNQFKRLSIYSKKKKLKFISTPLDLESAKFLSTLVDVFKISSGDNNFYELIEFCARFKKPIIISTGMLEFKEIKKIIQFLKRIKFPIYKLAILHCVSDYPVKDNEVNLLSIKFLNEKLKVTTGYSDHSLGGDACLAAISLGAKIIEKHFTLDNNFSKFRDHHLSLNPKDMKSTINSLRRIELMMGIYNKKISKSEKKNLNSMRRSLYFNQNLKKNTILEKRHIKIVRPFRKLKPNNLAKILGRKLKKNVKESEIVSFKSLK